MDDKFVARILLFIILINSRFKGGSAVKCFACEFNRNACPILGGCPSNRDRCSVGRGHFNHWTTPVVDCPAGCQTFLVTDPVGDVIVWKRGCSNQPPTGSRSNICTTEYVMGSFRVDSCVCNRYLCNASKGTFIPEKSIIASTLLLTILLMFSWKSLF